MSHDPTIMATLEMLAERWTVFSVEPWKRQPLARGIFEAILAATPGTFAPDELKSALRFYCNSLDYLRACREGADRIDLTGNVAGAVTAADAAYAARIIERRKRQNKAKSIAAKPVAPTAPPQPKPTRLSLADLREAAQRRKAAAT